MRSLFFFFVAACQREASTAPLGVGRAATEEEIREWQVTVLPDGTGLPAGSGSVAAGARVFAARCASCHGPRGDGPIRLVGGEGPTHGYRIGRAPPGEKPPTVVDYYPYATTLFDYTRRAMPYQEPGSLTDGETYSVVAWLLCESGLLREDAVLDAESLPRVRMPALAHFAFAPP